MKMKNPNADLVDKLVQANRILYDQGVVDGFGHVSVRHNSEPEVFLLSCNRAPGLVKRQDIVCYGTTGRRCTTPLSGHTWSDSSMGKSTVRGLMSGRLSIVIPRVSFRLG